MQQDGSNPGERRRIKTEDIALGITRIFRTENSSKKLLTKSIPYDILYKHSVLV